MKDYLLKMSMDIVREIFRVIIAKQLSKNTPKMHRLDVKAVRMSYAALNVILANDSLAFNEFD